MAHTGTPRTKFLVPSIGSITHGATRGPGVAELLAHDRVAGAGPASVIRSCSSTARSASVTGVRSGLVSTEVLGLEAVQADRVGLVGQHVCQPHVLVVAPARRHGHRT